MRRKKFFLIVSVVLVLGIGSVAASHFLSKPEEDLEFRTVFLESNLDLTETEFELVLDEEDYATHTLNLFPGTYQYRAKVDGFLPITGTLQVGEEDQILNLYFAKYEVTFVDRGWHPVWSHEGNKLAYKGVEVSIFDIASSHIEQVEMPLDDPNLLILGWAGKDIVVSAGNAHWAVINSDGNWQAEKISDDVTEWSGDFSTGIIQSEAAEIGLTQRQDSGVGFDQYNVPRDLHSAVVSERGKYIAGIIPESPDESGFLVDGLLQVYSSDAKAYVRQDKANNYVAGKMEFSPCENYLAYLVQDEEGQHLVVEDLANSKDILMENAGMVWAWSHFGNRLLWVHDNTIMLADLATDKQTELLQLDSAATNLAFADENRLVYVVDGCLYVYDSASHENQLIDDNAVDYVSVSPTQDMLVYVADGHIAIAQLP